MKSNINIEVTNQNHLDSQNKKPKLPIKFNRKRQSIKLQKRKSQQNLAKAQRICFISPDKVNLNIIDKSYSHQKDKASQKILNFNLLRQQQYIISSNANTADNANDSILSLYQQLQNENQRQRQSKLYQYIQIMEGLYLQLDIAKTENKKLKKKIQSLQHLQQFLMQRESYISQVTDRNILLHEKNICLQTDKQKLVKQLSDSKKKHDQQKDLRLKNQFQFKQQLQLQKQEIQMMIQLNYKMHEELEKNQMKQGQKNKKIIRSRKSEEIQNSDRRRLIKSKSNQILLMNLCINSIGDPNNESDTRITNRIVSDRSYYDESQLPRVPPIQLDISYMKARSMDGEELFERINMKNEFCECQPKIKKLQQKIRYLQIQIDILKKIKFDSAKIKKDYQKIKFQNDTLKDYNKRLLKKIQTLKIHPNNMKKINKNMAKNNFSDSSSSLQLSLSPMKR